MLASDKYVIGKCDKDKAGEIWCSTEQNILAFQTGSGWGQQKLP